MKTPLRKPLRLWPGVALVILQLVLRYVVPVAVPDWSMYGVLGAVVAGMAVILWWLFLSRAAWLERLGAVLLIAAAYYGTSRIVDKSIATGGMGMLLPILVTPVLSIAFVVWAVATSRLSDRVRRLTMAVTIILACGYWALIKTGGFTASLHNDLYWRWAKTPEDRLVAQSNLETMAPLQPVSDTPVSPAAAKVNVEPAAAPAAPAAEPRAGAPEKSPENPSTKVPTVLSPAEHVEMGGADWPGFRGPQRDGVVRGVRIQTDWKASPPTVIWRRPIGPGWSSFAVHNDLIYTQEQRGPEEVVACYRLSTGKPVWAHRDQARFWESNGGPGPRGTPTLSNGLVYTFGATGILNVLNAADGKLIWTRNAATDTGTKTPDWGFASSPLVVGDIVVVAVAGQLVAYDLATGTQRWSGPARGVSYSSPLLMTVDGVKQLLLLSEPGATSVALADGSVLWEHAWKGYPIVQPALTPNGDVLMSVSDSSGLRRLSIAHGSNGWNLEEKWTSLGLKPYFNDSVVHKGYAYGFDGSIMSCIDLNDGKRKWKGGRYGNGQLVLLDDQDVMLVQAEEGDLALVGATPDQFTELARIPALEGKTWNHPVVAGNVLLVRNGQEMAAFRLSPEVH